MLDRKLSKAHEPLLIRGSRQHAKGCQGELGFCFCGSLGVIESSRGFNGRHHGVKLDETTAFYGAPDRRPLGIIAVLERVNEGQGGFALGQIVSRDSCPAPTGLSGSRAHHP